MRAKLSGDALAWPRPRPRLSPRRPLELIRSICSPVSAAAVRSLLANRPTSSAEAVASFPPEYAAEPKLAHAGGRDGLDLVRRILAGRITHLTPNGALVVEIGRGRDLLPKRVSQLAVSVLDTVESGARFSPSPRSDLDERG